LRINKEIRARDVRLIDETGKQVGIVDTRKAIEMAVLAGVDLVEISPNSDPPVCKLLDYGKYRYELEKKAKENSRKQAQTELKGMRFTLKCDEADYQTKVGHIRRFLLNGNRTRVFIKFRGREMSHKDQGRTMLDRIATDVASLGVVENQPKFEGKQMFIMIAPIKQKAKE